MSNIIQPAVLKGLMDKRGLTQQALADLTAAHRTPVSLATIKRVCSLKRRPARQRANTIAALAKALKVAPETLTGDEALARDKGDPLNVYVTVKHQVTRNVDLSFQSVEAIYGIPRSAQVAMAPLFAALIAETSLKWRQERLEEVGSIADKLDSLRGDNPLLNGAFSRTWEAEKVEQKSIELKDVLGHRALKELEELIEFASKGFGSLMGHDVPNLLPGDGASPFRIFLKDYIKSFKNTQIEIDADGYDESDRMSDGLLEYRIGKQLIDDICGDSTWARRALELGYISLNAIPNQLLGTEQIKQRLDFLKSQIPEAERNDVAREFARQEIERLNELRAYEDKEPLEITEERIARFLSPWDEGEMQ